MSEQPAQSSGLQTADAVICARESYLHSLVVIADGTNVATVVLYDNATAASGTVLAKCIIPAGARTAMLDFHGSVHANNGIYADVTGTGAEYIVEFRTN